MTGAEADSAARLADEMNLQEILEIHYLMHFVYSWHDMIKFIEFYKLD